ncbi:Hypothetical predicted protein [Cloeon dipterum]|uniref:Uncharacterized protein n=1 Tax=Cloeon dipterum TaxID=197152 RepID=A0A8S1DT14_9INSE|nr:Hypothetical predicted protein [Cloeon dipterum]
MPNDPAPSGLSRSIVILLLIVGVLTILNIAIGMHLCITSRPYFADGRPVWCFNDITTHSLWQILSK